MVTIRTKKFARTANGKFHVCLSPLVAAEGYCSSTNLLSFLRFFIISFFRFDLWSENFFCERTCTLRVRQILVLLIAENLSLGLGVKKFYEYLNDNTSKRRVLSKKHLNRFCTMSQNLKTNVTKIFFREHFRSYYQTEVIRTLSFSIYKNFWRIVNQIWIIQKFKIS